MIIPFYEIILFSIFTFFITIFFFSKLLYFKFAFINTNILILYNLIIASFLGILIIVIIYYKNYGLFSSIFSIPFDINSTNYIYSLLSIDWCIITFSASSYFFSKKYLPNYKKSFLSFYKSEFDIEDYDNSYFYLILIIILFFIFVIDLFVILQSPMYNYIFKENFSSEYIRNSRSIFDTSSNISIIIKNLTYGLVSIFSYIILIIYLQIKKKKWLILFLCYFILTCILASLSGSKSGLAYNFLPIIFIYNLYNKRKTILNVILFIFIIFSIILFYFIVGYKVEINNIFSPSQPLGRLLFGQILGLPYYYDIFPKEYKFLLGLNLPFLRFFGYQYLTSARIVMIFLSPDKYLFSTAYGVNNTLFIGDAYANFGFFGIILSPIYVSILYQYFFILLLKSKKKVINVGFIMYILYILSKSITGGFISEYIMNTHLILVSIFFFFILFFYKLLRKRSIN